jgi:cytochrome c biogenesis protein
MSALEESKPEVGVKPAAASAGASESAVASLVTRGLNLLSSVRFGVALLMIAVVFSMIGMLIVQKNVEGFEKYFADMTPATRLLFGSLGFFDIYHSWYFRLLMLVLSLNIVLASIDRFPGAWSFVSRPKLDASERWLRGQDCHAALSLAGESRESVAARVAAAAKSVGLKSRVTEKSGKTFVFSERGAWNRLGAYAVHVALLTIFTGGFLTGTLGQNGQMPARPGASANQMSDTDINLGDDGLQLSKSTIQLPFDVECTDIQQKLIKQDGGLEQGNTIDWFTKIRIKDPQRGTTEALVHLNDPYDYRGYRFFQASYINVGRARSITLRLTREADGYQTEVTIPRDGAINLSDGTRIDFSDFEPDFTMSGGQIATASAEYNNPAAILSVRGADGSQARAYAFAGEAAARAPMLNKAVGGYRFKLVAFEKQPDAHILSVQRDPGATVFYVGSAMLIATLISVFFFAHQRVWAVVSESGAGNYSVVLGGNTNRNAVAFEEKFKRFVAALTGGSADSAEATEAEVQA